MRSTRCAARYGHGMAGQRGQTLSEADIAVLEEIKAGLKRDGYAPTIRELAGRLGYRWPQSVQRRVERLVQAGELQRHSGQLRTLVPKQRSGATKAIRWVTVIGAGGMTPMADRAIPLPVADLLKEGEQGVALIAERGIAGGPAGGDVVYCARGRKAGRGDLVAIQSAEGRLLLRRSSGHTARARSDHDDVIGVVVAWLHRATSG